MARCGACSWLVRCISGTACAMGGWQAPYGSHSLWTNLPPLMLFFGALLIVVAVYACVDIDHERFRWVCPLAQSLIMMMGVNGAFSGDIFNLYVWFEVLLIASFVLLALGASGVKGRIG